MDIGLGMESGTDGHLILCKAASYVHKPVCKFNTKNTR